MRQYENEQMQGHHGWSGICAEVALATRWGVEVLPLSKKMFVVAFS